MSAPKDPRSNADHGTDCGCFDYRRMMAERDRCREAYEALNAWVSRMPDAGFDSDDPRWGWWHERPRVLDSVAGKR